MNPVDIRVAEVKTNMIQADAEGINFPLSFRGFGFFQIILIIHMMNESLLN